MSKNKKRQIEQVSSKTLIPPEQPDEVTENDVDFATEEAELDAQMKAIKEKKAKLAARKKQAMGGKKLSRMRSFASDTTEWALKAAEKFTVSVTRANDAVGKLCEYEDKLDIPKAKRVGEKLAESLELLTEAAEVAQANKD